MQTLTIHVQDDFMPVFMKMIAGFNHEIYVDEIKPVAKKRDLSKLITHPNVINGNPDDLLNVDWAQEWSDELPK
ncbi:MULTISPECIES: hypothetical protein [unclassified Acinetobacter]|uniref:hypothetical protein n=1 Tax=unclassified Acinetobacter TaxID=196816 RepID=UPI0035B808BC